MMGEAMDRLLPSVTHLVGRRQDNGVSEGVSASEAVDHPDLECEEDVLHFPKLHVTEPKGMKIRNPEPTTVNIFKNP